MQSASLTLDHVTMVVPDLEEARATLGGLGFTDMDYGFTSKLKAGEIKTMVVPFADGSSLYLMSLPKGWKRLFLYGLLHLGWLDWAFQRSQPPAKRFIKAIARGQGLVDATCHMQALDVLAAAMGARGIESDGSYPAVSTRYDGQVLKYHIFSLPEAEDHLPMVISDETPRIMRVPMAGNCYHVNGVRGVAGYVFPVYNLEVSASYWAAFTGSSGVDVDPPEGAVLAKEFFIGHVRIMVIQPDGHDSFYDQVLNTRGQRPAEISLWIRHGLKARIIPPDMLYGIRIHLIPLPEGMADPAPWDEEEKIDQITERVEAETLLQQSHYNDWRKPPSFSIPESLKQKIK